VGDDVEQIESPDPELEEVWQRLTSEPEIRAVSASRWDAIGGWQVAVSAMEFVHDDPLETELRQRIATALRAVSGVASAEEQDNEKWFVAGNPSGKALVEAAVQVLDDLADRMRAYHLRRIRRFE
jgi:hypothetical protein